MSDWRPSSGPDAARRRAALLSRARDYFAHRDVLAVDTPALSRFAGSDPHVDSLAVRSGSGARYFLHTSPEFCMKRLLAAGYPDIYSICRVYRDGEAGARHLSEFTMIEWYRLGFSLADIVADATSLIACCVGAAGLADDVEILDYREAFLRHADVDVVSADAGRLAERAGADECLRETIGDDRDAWLDLLLVSVVAPLFAADRLTVLQHYPASKATLARLCPDDRRFADRFEVFAGTMELANGYVELTDAAEQRRRFGAELELRRRAGRVAPPRDERLLRALEAGLPECAGVAVGVERLHMVLDRSDAIRDVVTFAGEATDG